jgi:hypothetical protein
MKWRYLPSKTYINGAGEGYFSPPESDPADIVLLDKPVVLLFHQAGDFDISMNTPRGYRLKLPCSKTLYPDRCLTDLISVILPATNG